MSEKAKQSAINKAANLILKHKVDTLQVVPAVALKLLRLTSDETASVADLSQLIETAPSLAAKVLRNVNSAAFALSHKITSIKRAVNFLGFSAVRQLALNQLLYNKLIDQRSKNEFNQLLYWQHCLFVATLSRAIAVATRHEDPDLIYCAGLMHDIGKIVFETHGKVTYSDFLLACRADEQSSLRGERDFFGLNHAEIGFVFCQQWDIPEQIAAIIYCHHDLPKEGTSFAKYKADIAIVNFANYVAWMQGLGSSCVNSAPELHEQVSSYLDIAALDLDSLLSHVDAEMQHTREFYGIEFPSANTLRATVIETALLLTNYNKTKESPKRQFENISVASLTVPHKSLDPDEIIPWTLSAIKADFDFERLILLNVKAKQRSLVATYSCPDSIDKVSLQQFSITLDTLPKSIINSLRERKAIIVNANEGGNKEILQQFQVDEFLIVPVLSHNRLVSLLYIDNGDKKQLITKNDIAQITPIVHELGVALANAKRFELEKQRAEIDSLTGLLNKRMVTEYMTALFDLNKDQLQQVAVGFIDIDFFKKFNDTCGHQAGDDVLKIVAQIMRTLTRPSDFIGRYGGEEFVFVLHDTSVKGASCYAERIRLEIERKGKILSQRFKGHELTISIGVSLYDQNFTSYNQLIEAADSAMYTAKHKGRNCVVVA